MLLLFHKQLINSEFKSPKVIVGWMSAIQSQKKSGMIKIRMEFFVDYLHNTS